jgi:hypothetical protein
MESGLRWQGGGDSPALPSSIDSIRFDLSGCSKVCPAVGTLAGLFSGDASGDLVITVTESEEKDEADLEVRLTTDALEVFGGVVISCDGGAFDVVLETADVPEFGTFSGDLSQEGVSGGDWEFASGETGTWEAQLQ